MTRLYAYKQYIKSESAEGWHVTFSENPPEATTLNNPVCLGVLELMHPDIVAAKDMRDATVMFEPEPEEANG